jgi:hypothetical protein
VDVPLTTDRHSSRCRLKVSLASMVLRMSKLLLRDRDDDDDDDEEEEGRRSTRFSDSDWSTSPMSSLADELWPSAAAAAAVAAAINGRNTFRGMDAAITK